MDTCYLIDFQSIARPIYEANANSDVTRTSGDIVQRIRNIASGRLHTALCCDSGRSWRKDIAPDYKANRKETPPAYGHQLAEALDTLKLDGFPIWQQEGWEADDIIAAAAKWLYPHVGHFIVVSGDKDMHQMVSEMVTVRRPAFQKYPELDFTPQAVMEKYGLDPSQLVDYFALCGDAADNVRGAEGIGEKTATPLLAAFRTLDAALLAAKETPERFKPGTLKSLLEFAPRADTVRQLIRLRTEGCEIDFSPILTPRTPLDVAEFDGSEGVDFAMQPLAEENDIPASVEAKGLVETVLSELTTSKPAAFEPPVVEQPTAPKKQEPLKFDAAPAQPSTALVTREQPQDVQLIPAGRFLQPRSLRDAHNLSLAVAKSRLFAGIGSAESALVRMVAGEELGIPAMASVRAFHSIEDKEALTANTIHSLMLRASVVDYFYNTERTDKSATFVGRRKADGYPEMRVTYTVEDAKRAWSKSADRFLLSGWGKNPADMCVARALTKLARLIAPDVLEGHYAKEEFDE